MNLSRMTEDVSNITNQPNQVTGKAADLKKLFDKAGEDVKKFLNDVLIQELEEYLSRHDTSIDEILISLSEKLNKQTGKTSEITNDGDGSSPFATTEEVAQAIANLVDSSPDALDTLKELADALGNDPEFSTTVLNLIGAKVGKTTYEEDKSRLENDISNLEREIVNNASGKGLSEEEKQKLSDLPTNEELQRVLETKATKEEVDAKIAQISDSIPETMTKDYIDKKLDSPRDKILLTDQTTQEIYELYIDNGVIKVFNTKDSILVMGNNAAVNEEVLILSNGIATVLNETLLINEGTLK